MRRIVRSSHALFTAFWFVLIAVSCGCGGSVGSAADAGTEASAEANGAGSIGSPCVPSQDTSPTFASHALGEVSLDSANPHCGGNICLVNHFSGRVGCPYGQDRSGQPPAGALACTVPGSTTPIAAVAVDAQCTDRPASKSVTCSCRCANVDNRTDDGATYCTCPTGLTCTLLVTSLGASTSSIAGSYCILTGTGFSPDAGSRCASPCAPNAAPCN